MAKNLLIVESPAKAKTIEKYLGKDFTVRASYGHVRDLPKGNEAVDIRNGFEPKYEVMPDKERVISELKKLVKESESVWLATDEDREGEAISWHLAEVLGLDVKTTRRIVFNEITKTAIQRAVQQPRALDLNLVNAQQARRVLDRIVGFELSPILWSKIKTGLSAGRVQSVAVRLIVDREREVTSFNATSSYKVTADFALEKNAKLTAERAKNLPDQQAARAFLESCIGAAYTVADLQKKPAKKTPAPPFTTSTLQQEASRKLNFSVSQTMRVAQKLYEEGHITYMRTDSVALSEDAMRAAESAIKQTFGDKYHKARKYKNKNESAQEAHEAIRPTDFTVSTITADRQEQRLYELIWKRSIASQMADAELERTLVDIAISTNGEFLNAEGEVIVFDGFLKVYLESTDDDEDDEDKKALPPLTVGQRLDLREMVAQERFTRPLARYTEASLVKALEEMGIGRPSTYAPTISTIQNREYVVKENRDGQTRNTGRLALNPAGQIAESVKPETFGAEKAKLFPTDLGMVVNDFLVKFFPNILDFTFTARVEEEFDEIADGKKEWRKMLGTFYGEFHPTVENTKKTAERESGDRELGTDPASGRAVIARLGRYGPMVQIGRTEEEEKPKYARLRGDQRLESITLDEALSLFKLPRSLGEFEDEEVKASTGRFGPYIQHGKAFVSLKPTDDPYTVTLERAIELIEEKRQAEANKLIKQIAADIAVLNGRWGPYVKYREHNLKLPKDINPATITLEDCDKLFEEQKDKPKKAPAKSSAKAQPKTPAKAADKAPAKAPAKGGKKK